MKNFQKRKDDFENRSADVRAEDLEFVLKAVTDIGFAVSGEFLEWLEKSEANRLLYKDCLLYRAAVMEGEEAYAPDEAAAWSRLAAAKVVRDRTFEKKKKRRLPHWGWAAAAVVLGVLLPYLTVERLQKKRLTHLEDQVTLQADAGKLVAVDEVDVAEAKEMGIKKARRGRYEVLDYSAPPVGMPGGNYTLSIPRGKAYQLLLEDGTEIWLNAGSKITFPHHFGQEQRLVKLKGEAYFKVSKDAKRPFIVQTPYLTTRVLGTEFNIKAYDKKHANVTLVEGKVLVEDAVSDKVVEMKPSQVVQITDSVPEVKNIDPAAAIAWREGNFYFDDASLEDIMNELARWYKVDVEFADQHLRQLRFKFWADRTKSIQEALAILNKTGKVTIGMEDPNHCLVSGRD